MYQISEPNLAIDEPTFEIRAWRERWARKRQLSLRTFHETLGEGELMPRGFDPEEEADRIEAENIDRPPTDGLTPEAL